MIITLTWPEMRLAAYVGMARQFTAMQRNRPERYTSWNGISPWEKHIGGAQSELAVAKMLNLFWGGTIDDIDQPDLIDRSGGRIQVRGTRHRNGELILHPGDLDDDIFYLVRAIPPLSFDIPGWLHARDGKHQKYWNTERGNPAFFVPAGDCNQVEPT